MTLVKKLIFAIAVNLVGTVVIYGVCRLVIVTPHQGVIDYIVLVLGSTAHFWYLHAVSWKVKIPLVLVSALLNAFAMLTFVTAVLREGT